MTDKSYVQGYFERDLEAEFRLYRQMYDLPTQHCVVEDAPGPFFNMCQKRRFFVIAFIYTADYKMFAIPEIHPVVDFTPASECEPTPQSSGAAYEAILKAIKARDFAAAPTNKFVDLAPSEFYKAASVSGMVGHYAAALNDADVRKTLRHDQCKFELAAGSIKLYERQECLVEAVHRVVNGRIPGANISELRPIVHLKNHFYSHSGHYVAHEGIGVMCRLQMTQALHSAFFTKRSESPGGILADISTFDGESFYTGGHRRVVTTAQTLLKNRMIDANEAEGDSFRKVRRRMALHDAFAKPVFNLVFGRLSTKAQVAKEIECVREQVKDVKVLDVSCGEDKFIFNIAKTLSAGSEVVGNDVAFDAIGVLSKFKKASRSQNVFLTCQSASTGSYKDRYFDVSLCKNSLHHMRDYAEVVSVIGNLIRVTSKKVVIVDYEDPHVTGLVPRMLNKYYRSVLLDEGDNFLTESEFNALFEDHKIKGLLRERNISVRFSCRKSQFGKVMMAVLDIPPVALN